MSFTESDVYLFAKTLWIILSKKQNGFFGQYIRNDNSKCLDRSKLRLGKTIEPLHILLECATKDDFRERISIESCIDLIEKQLRIANQEMPKDELNRYVFSEHLNVVKNELEADNLVYKKTEKIFSVIQQLIGAVELVIDNALHPLLLGLLRGVAMYSEDILVLNIRGAMGKTELFICVDSLLIDTDNHCKCIIKKTNAEIENSINRISTVQEMNYIGDKKVLMDMKIELLLKSPS